MYYKIVIQEILDYLSSSEFISILGTVGVLIAAIAAWRSASSAAMSVKVTQNSSDAQLAKLFLDQFGIPEWNTSMQILEHFTRNKVDRSITRNIHSDTSTQYSNYSVTPGSPEDTARLKIFWFYRNAWFMYKKGYLNKELMELITDSEGYELFHDVCQPLTYNLDSYIDIKDGKWGWYDELAKEFPQTNLRKLSEYMRRSIDTQEGNLG